MAVLVEALTVVVPFHHVDKKLRGGIDFFLSNIPNQTFRHDQVLAAISFMVPDDVQLYVTFLEMHGLSYVVDGKAKDLAVVDQLKGSVLPCDWLHCLLFPWEGDPEKAVMIATNNFDDIRQGVAVCEGWCYEGSLSQQGKDAFTKTEDMETRFESLGRGEDGYDVYRERSTNENRFIKRLF